MRTVRPARAAQGGRAATADSAFTAVELGQVATRAARAGATVEGVRHDLARHQNAMTPEAQLRFKAFKAEPDALPSPPLALRRGALDILSGSTGLKPTLPAWYPKDFDLAHAANQLRAELLAQGMSPKELEPGQTRHLFLTDADLTLINTGSVVYLRNRVTGERVLNPTTGKPFELGGGALRDSHVDLRRLKKEFPALPWEHLEKDYEQLHSAEELARQATIAPARDLLNKSARRRSSKQVVITARSGPDIGTSMRNRLAAQNMPVAAVLTVNKADHRDALKIPADTSVACNKVLHMAALIHLLDPKGSAIRSVRFVDDSDENLVAAMQVLPLLFPNIRWEFLDVVHLGHGRFDARVVARSSVGGDLVDMHGKPMSQRAIDTYASRDASY